VVKGFGGGGGGLWSLGGWGRLREEWWGVGGVVAGGSGKEGAGCGWRAWVSRGGGVLGGPEWCGGAGDVGPSALAGECQSHAGLGRALAFSSREVHRRRRKAGSADRCARGR